MDSVEKVNQAFLQLSYCLKNMCYFEMTKVDKNLFDCDTHFNFSSIILPASEFKTYDDLILASQNNVMICLGFTTIVLDFVVNDASLRLSQNTKNLVDLLHMIRCAFAHDMIEPKWNITKSQYNRPIEISLVNSKVNIDLTSKNGEPFKIEDIGGYENYYKMKDEIIKLLTKL